MTLATASRPASEPIAHAPERRTTAPQRPAIAPPEPARPASDDAANAANANREAAPSHRGGPGARIAAQAALIGGDAASYAVVMGLLVALVGPEPWMQRVLIVVALVALAGYATEGLYPGYRTHGHERVRRRVRTTLKVAAMGGLGAAIILGEVAPGVLIAAFLALALALQPAIRWAVCSLLGRGGWWGEPAVILASPNRAPILHEHFARHRDLGIRPLPPGATGVRLALLASDAVPLQDELDRLRSRFAEVVLLADTPRLQINGLRPADLRGEIGVRLAAAAPGRGSEALRRACDLALALPATVVAVPLVLLAAAAVYVVDPGPVFYRQPREGLGGRTVRVLKLRTMFRDAEARLDEVLSRDPQARAEWAAHFKLRHDPRILPVVGAFLRSSSLDELPQLWNVILGEMRIVGPRPFPAYHVEAMTRDFRLKRRSIVPGLTGLWQISERGEADLQVQHQLDEFYIDNRSLWLDWSIVLGTVSAVVRRSGT